ncbi:acyl-CoA dehydrogenase family protein [Streptomyces sp. S.PB5]|uniref:acyl-CoA dehydrogenase family protein n=1 Tax=Streptomyces sp. S.PB5 TaxID=3020844 RepID=UPI0025AFA1CE|nr:acyl-CoA dehydrogenase family protein [Streptomyces sp. S.PB5]MDN3022226.1 acyl-CoA dehydrogenase family protein [Streptomyces sp. S.PB5]
MTMEHSPYRLAEELELYLGDPADPRSPFSDAASASLDAREEFPAEICRLLDDWGLPDYYVPAPVGGRLRDYEHALQLLRTVARRDLTVAVAHGKTYLGAVCVWIAGSAEQAARLGADIRAGVPVALGLTERAHGSDLLAGEVEAVPDGPGAWRVSGEKWLINNATRGSVLTLLARTGPDGGPRGFSVLLADKRELPPGSYRHLPKIPTHGIRGADISGIALHRARLPRTTVVGTEGGGIETVLKALQLTRTMCASLSLGAADHGLSLALGFAAERRLYGRPLAELPQARHVLASAAADVLTHEALSLVAARLVHTATGELSVVSAVTKYLVPTGTEELLRELAALLGARAFLAGADHYGLFEKVERDHRIVSLFDGNTLVNLNSLVNQFRSLVRHWGRGQADEPVAACDLSVPLPEFDARGLSLLSRYGSSVLGALPAWVARAESHPALAAAARRLLTVTEKVHEEMAAPWDLAAGVPYEAFETARRYCLCFAGAACLGLWLHNRLVATDGVWRDGVWLRAALDRLLVRLGEQQGPADPEAYERLLDEAYEAGRTDRLFSLLRLGLARETV